MHEDRFNYKFSWSELQKLKYKPKLKKSCGNEGSHCCYSILSMLKPKK